MDEAKIRISVEDNADISAKNLRELIAVQQEMLASVNRMADATKKENEEVRTQTGLIEKLEKQLSSLKMARRQAEDIEGVKRYNEQIKATEKELNELTNTAEKTGVSFKNMAVLLGGFFAVDKLMEYSGQLFNMVNETDRLRTAMQNASESNGDYIKSLTFLNQLSDQYGQNVNVLTKSYSNFIASSVSSNLSLEERQRIYASVVKAGSALKMSNDDMEGSLRALSQMFSKGNVQAEELRGQLGERLPGAFDMAAKAMGVTTKQLNKMLEDGQVLAVDLLPKLATELENMYGSKAQSNLQTVGGQWNRLTNSIINYTAKANEATGFTKILAAGMAFVADNMSGMIRFLGSAIAAFGIYQAAINLAIIRKTAFSTAMGIGNVIMGQANLLRITLAGTTDGLSAAQLRGAASARAFNASLALGPTIAITAALYALSEIYSSVKKNVEEANAVNLTYIKQNDEVIKSEQSRTIEFKIAIDHIKSLKEGTEARTHAVQQAINKFPEYLSGIKAEITSNAYLEGVYKNVNAQMLKRIDLMAREKQVSGITEQATVIKRDLLEKGVSANTVAEYITEIKGGGVSSAWMVQVQKYEQLTKQLAEAQKGLATVHQKAAEDELKTLDRRYGAYEILKSQQMEMTNEIIKKYGITKKTYTDEEVLTQKRLDGVVKEVGLIQGLNSKIKELGALRDASGDPSKIKQYNSEIANLEKQLKQLTDTTGKANKENEKAEKSYGAIVKKSQEDYEKYQHKLIESQANELRYLEQNNEKKVESERKVQESLRSIGEEQYKRQKSLDYLREVQTVTSLEQLEEINTRYANEAIDRAKRQRDEEYKINTDRLKATQVGLTTAKAIESKILGEIAALRENYEKANNEQQKLAKTKANKAALERLENEKKDILKSIGLKEDELKYARKIQEDLLKLAEKHQTELEKIEKEITKAADEEGKKQLEAKKKLLEQRRDLEVKMAKDGYDAAVLSQELLKKKIEDLDEKELAQLNAHYIKKQVVVKTFNKLEREAKEKYGEDFHQLSIAQQNALLEVIQAQGEKEKKLAETRINIILQLQRKGLDANVVARKAHGEEIDKLSQEELESLKEHLINTNQDLQQGLGAMMGGFQQIIGLISKDIQRSLREVEDEEERVQLESKARWADWANSLSNTINQFASGNMVGGIIGLLGNLAGAFDNIITKNADMMAAKLAKQIAAMKAAGEEFMKWSDAFAPTDMLDSMFAVYGEWVKDVEQTFVRLPNELTTAQMRMDAEIGIAQQIISNYNISVDKENKYHALRLDNINAYYSAERKRIEDTYSHMQESANIQYSEQTRAVNEELAKQLLLLIENEDSKASIEAEYARKKNERLAAFADADEGRRDEIAAELSNVNNQLATAENDLLKLREQAAYTGADISVKEAELKKTIGELQATSLQLTVDYDSITASIEARNQELAKLLDWYVRELETIANSEGQKRKEYSETEKLRMDAEESLELLRIEKIAADLQRNAEKNNALLAAEQLKNQQIEIITEEHNNVLAFLGLEKDRLLKESFENFKQAFLEGYNEMLAAAHKAYEQGELTAEQYNNLRLRLFQIKNILGEIDWDSFAPPSWDFHIPNFPRYASGTEYVPRGGNPFGTDQIPAMIDEGERIISRKENAPLYAAGLSNRQVSEYALNWDKAVKGMAIPSEMLSLRISPQAANSVSASEISAIETVLNMNLKPVVEQLKQTQEAISKIPINNFSLDEKGFRKWSRVGNSLAVYHKKRFGS